MYSASPFCSIPKHSQDIRLYVWDCASGIRKWVHVYKWSKNVPLFYFAPDITNTTRQPLLFNYATRHFGNQSNLFSSHFIYLFIYFSKWPARIPLWIRNGRGFGYKIRLSQFLSTNSCGSGIFKNRRDAQVVTVRVAESFRLFVLKVFAFFFFLSFDWRWSQAKLGAILQQYREGGGTRGPPHNVHTTKRRGAKEKVFSFSVAPSLPSLSRALRLRACVLANTHC